jgi:hypothetical protein
MNLTAGPLAIGSDLFVCKYAKHAFDHMQIRAYAA